MSLAEQQRTREKASALIESRQEPDRYHLLIIDGKLCSPFTRLPVEMYMDTTSEIGFLEYSAFDQVQRWASEREEGLAFWVSGPHERRSNQTKVAVYEVASLLGEKAVLNRMLLFDIGYDASLEIANKIAEKFGYPYRFTNTEEVRANTIFSKLSLKQEQWLPVMGDIITDQRQWKMIEKGEDVLIENQALMWVSQGTAHDHRGDNPLSCPLFASDILSQHSKTLEGRFVKNCGQCGAEIKKVIFKGYKCPRCGGTYEGC